MLRITLLGAIVAIGCEDLPVSSSTTDFEAEMRRLDNRFAAVAQSDLNTMARLAYHRAVLSGEADDAGRATELAGRARRESGTSVELALLQADLALMRHRPDGADRVLATIPSALVGPEVVARRADVLMQRGRFLAALHLYEQLLMRRRDWRSLCRMAAALTALHDLAGAEALYAKAQDQLTSKEMRAYAWIEIQRGRLDARRGKQESARAHYLHADKAYSGYWLTARCLAGVSE